MTSAVAASTRDAGEIDGRLVCTQVRPVTHDVVDLVLSGGETGPAWFGFEPGQHLTVTVEVEGRRLSRCYSISSPPTRGDSLTLTVKRVPGGLVSGWLHDHVRVGDLVEVSGPLGRFTPARALGSRHLFLSAGSGITPLMSMARTLLDESTPADVLFVHHARTPADIVFRDELERMQGLHPGLRVVVVCEDDQPGDRWPGHRGRISADFLALVAPDLAERDVFVCGPAPYMAAARRHLAELGVDPARVHEESFDLAEPTPSAHEPAAGATTYSVELRRSGQVVACPAGTTVLDAAARAGLTLPSSCREGVCGTCKTTVLSGRVEMHHGGGIRQREIDRGQVLLCCSTPTEDLVLDA